MQTGLQPSLFSVLPSSHSSRFSSLPLPQQFRSAAGLAQRAALSLLQEAEQPSPLVRLPSSHSSPSSITRLPQALRRLPTLAQNRPLLLNQSAAVEPSLARTGGGPTPLEHASLTQPGAWTESHPQLQLWGFSRWPVSGSQRSGPE